MPRQTTTARRLGTGLSRSGRASSHCPSPLTGEHTCQARGQPPKNFRSRPLRHRHARPNGHALAAAAAEHSGAFQGCSAGATSVRWSGRARTGVAPGRGSGRSTQSPPASPTAGPPPRAERHRRAPGMYVRWRADTQFPGRPRCRGPSSIWLNAECPSIGRAGCSATPVLFSDHASEVGAGCAQVHLKARRSAVECVVVFSCLAEHVLEPLVVSGEVVDAFGQVLGAEGVELLSELMPESVPHSLFLFPEVSDLLPGQFEFRAQRRAGGSGACGSGGFGLLALLGGFDVFADAFGVGEPGGAAGCAGDRSVSDLFALCSRVVRAVRTRWRLSRLSRRRAWTRVCALPRGFMPGPSS